MIYAKECELTKDKDFILGQYIYLGMGKCNGIKVCISVAYKIDYCMQKAKEFVNASNDLIVFYKINKVKVGELKRCDELIVKLNEKQ
jgi:glyoxylate carboligase